MSAEQFLAKYECLDANEKKQMDAILDKLSKHNNDVPDAAIPLFGALKGKIWMSPDFDEPLQDFKDYM